jgi:hypothetical protein
MIGPEKWAITAPYPIGRVGRCEFPFVDFNRKDTESSPLGFKRWAHSDIFLHNIVAETMGEKTNLKLI